MGVSLGRVLSAIATTGWANGLLLYPSRFEIDTDARRRTIQYKNGTLELWTLRSPRLADREPECFVLTFAGNGDRAERCVPGEADSWKDVAAEVWGVNYPGYGGSSGQARLADIPAAALLAYDAIKTEAGSRPVFVSGCSMGTTAALYVAANRPVAGVILRSPPPLRSLILGRHGWWNLWIAAGIIAWQIPRELDSLANAAKVRVPGIFILTQQDEIVPMAYQENVLRAYSRRTYVVHLEGGHNERLSGMAVLEYDNAIRWLRAEGSSNSRSSPEK